MSRRPLQPSRLRTILAMALLVPLALAPEATAQTLLGVDPYRPYNRNYIPYSVPPTPSSNFNALEGARYDGASRANQMGAYFESLYGTGGESLDGFRRSGAGLPYSAANRQYDKEYDREYRSNKTDTQYYKDQETRSRDYFEALREPDPRKRAEMLRKVEEETLRASRALGPNARRPTPTGAARPPTNPPRTSALPPTDPRVPPPSSTTLDRTRTLPGSSLVAPREPEAEPANVPEGARSARPTEPGVTPANPAFPSRSPARRLRSPYPAPERRQSPYLPPEPAAEPPPR